MISCIDKTELEKFLRGKLEPERMLAIDQHLSECPGCRAEASSLPTVKAVAGGLGSALVGAGCPEYEELSAYVDGSLSPDQARSVLVHTNMCEFCAEDVARMRELRSQAALRGTITVKPGETARRATLGFGLWQRVVGGIVGAGAIAAVAMVLMNAPKAPMSGAIVADKPSTGSTAPAPGVSTHKDTPPAHTGNGANGVTNTAQAPGVSPEVGTPSIHPEPTVTAEAKPVLRDGKFAVIRRGSTLAMAKIDGSTIRTKLEARIMAAIEEKVKTGRITLAQPVQVAMNTLTRAVDGRTPPANAPKPISPEGKIILTGTPTLTWSRVDLAESYRVVITTQNGNVVFDETTDRNSLTIPRPLDRGREYRWQVGVRFSEGDTWANSNAARFSVISGDDFDSIQRIKTQMPGSRLALGAAYESFGLNKEAAAEYRALLKANPQSDLAKKMLASVAGGAR